MGWSPRCYIPSFVKINPSVLEKIFEGFLPYMGMGQSWSCDSDATNKILFSYPRWLHIKFGFDRPRGFWSRRCLKLFMTDGRRQTPDHGYTLSSPMSRAKNVYPCKPQFHYIKWGCMGVYTARTS